MGKKLPFLQVDKSKRFLEDSEGKPFFWLGDTAWELLHRLNLEDTQYYLKNRKEKGFNLIQTVILAELDGLHTPNANGDLPLLEDDPSTPNEAYFEHVDRVLSLANDLEIYLGLLPTWGDKYCKKWGIGPEVFTPENAEAYACYLGERYKAYPNIIWILGGDRIPDDDDDYQINCQMAGGLRRGGATQLMSYHPQGGNIASTLFGKEDWLDLDMFQSRHQKGCKEFKFTRKALQNLPIRPVIDGEPGYEHIPNFLNKMHIKRLDDADVRKSAYWNMTSGAAGHTYGCNELWQIYSPERKALHGACLHWKAALDLPGATQMGLMRQLFESLPWQTLTPDQSILRIFNWENGGHITAMSSPEKELVLAYNPNGRTIKFKKGNLNTAPYQAFWFDPKIGELIPDKAPVSFTFSVPDKKKDWLLLLFTADFVRAWKQPFL